MVIEILTVGKSGVNLHQILSYVILFSRIRMRTPRKNTAIALMYLIDILSENQGGEALE
jgi:hypothetical protein